MQYTLNQIYEQLLQKVNSVYDIFKNFFGEEFVDLQLKSSEAHIKLSLISHLHGVYNIHLEDGACELSDEQLQEILHSQHDQRAFIYVWWPYVTVTNEHGNSVNIQDLYAQIEVTFSGEIPYENRGFLLNRATYTSEQFYSNYMHSHIPRIPKSDFTHFESPCLGTGPIKGTIDSLKNDYDEVIWMLFCQELSMYVTVESLKGIPYRRLENIGRTDKLYGFEGYSDEDSSSYAFTRNFRLIALEDFIKYYIEHGHLSLSFKNGRFIVGMPYHEYIIDVSNAFIDYYNTHLKTTAANIDKLFNTDLLKKAFIINGKFFTNKSSNSSYSDCASYIGRPVLTFKDRPITLSIQQSVTNEATPAIVIDNSIAMFIINNILKVINFRYKNEYNYKHRGIQTSSSTYKKVLYI